MSGSFPFENKTPSYRADIDGLRAIAILSVLAFHAFPKGLRGGFVGVDIFVVISGYLISTIIFQSLMTQRFRFTDFYTKRIRRIFPALLTVLIASYVAAYFFLVPDELQQFGKHLAGSVAYVQNLILLREAGYFDTATEVKPLMHLWSLAIEEQFYVAFPLFAFLAWRFGLNLLLLVILAITLSFTANVMEVQKNIVRAFFFPQTRFWELLVGSLLAYIVLAKAETVNWILPQRLVQFVDLFTETISPFAGSNLS